MAFTVERTDSFEHDLDGVIVYRAEGNRVIFLRLFNQQQFYENRLGLSE